MVHPEEGLDELWNLLQEPWQSTRIEEWCERRETHWKQPPDQQSGEWKVAEDEPTQKEKEMFVSKHLLVRLMESACHEEEKEMKTSEEEHPSIQQQQLRLVLRTSKNFLRGILQTVFSPTATNSSQVMTTWRPIQLLRQYFSWVQQYCEKDPVLAQHASQLLFYASYNPVSGSDEGLVDSYDQLLEQDQIMSRLLSCLLRSLNDIPLALSILRNVHNIIVSFPRGMECTFAAQCSLEVILPDFPENSTATFPSILPYFALRALNADPPGNDDNHHKRAELVVEILRAAYVLRLGKQIETDPQGLFGQLIVKLLRLDIVTKPQCEECRREAIPPLMDATAEAVATFVFNQDVLQPLWSILEQQVTQVVEQTLVQDSAAAALTPILVVLHKIATHHEDIRRQLKSHIFPDDEEDTFHEKKRREIEQHGKCRNMKPLDAPQGTLRCKLVQLMTWPQSHIKRFTGELLWSLCEADSQEFIARVGMGNAVAILGARGLVRLPGQT